MTGECVLDADVVIAVLDAGDSHHESAVRLVRRVAGEGSRMLLSLVNYAEVLVRPAAEPETLRAAAAAIDALRIELVPPTVEAAQAAAGLRNLGISLPDGFVLAIAVGRRSPVATFDRKVRQAARAAGAELAAMR